MSELTDELLDELQSLDDTTDQLEEQLGTLSQAQKTQTTAGEINTVAAMLAATKITQDATLQSQEAAETNLKISREQHMLMENFEEQNLNLRQTLSQARQDFSSSKGFFVGVLVIVLLTGFTLGGLLSWNIYQTKNNQEDFKNEVIDIIQTQSHLNQRNIQNSLNQITALIDITHPNSDKELFVEVLGENKLEETAVGVETSSTNEATTPTYTTPIAPRPNAQLNQELEELKASQTQVLEQLQGHINQLAKAQTTSGDQPELKRIDQQLTNLNQLIKNQNLQLNKLVAQLDQLNKKPAPAAKPTAQKPATQPTKPDPTLTKLNQISKELELLKNQQAKTQEAINQLTQEVSENEAAQPNIDKDAYIYRSPYEYNSGNQ